MIKTESVSAKEHEIKFVLNNSSAHFVLRWLQTRCLPDHDFPSGIVSSIYYDTWDWRFLYEKINSDYLKTKVRVRWYADIDTEVPNDESFLEAKYKIGSRREKVRIKTCFSGAWLSRVNLDNNKLLTIPHLLRPRGLLISEHLYPVFQISYKRWRFVEPLSGARLCIDCDIWAPRVNWQMLPRINAFRLRNAVFELKGRITELPDVLHQLTALGCKKQSFSKYLVCYEKIMRIAV